VPAFEPGCVLPRRGAPPSRAGPAVPCAGGPPRAARAPLDSGALCLTPPPPLPCAAAGTTSCCGPRRGWRPRPTSAWRGPRCWWTSCAGWASAPSAWRRVGLLPPLLLLLLLLAPAAAPPHGPDQPPGAALAGPCHPHACPRPPKQQLRPLIAQGSLGPS
jgi:hypothetical protein